MSGVLALQVPSQEIAGRQCWALLPHLLPPVPALQRRRQQPRIQPHARLAFAWRAARTLLHQQSSGIF